MVHNKMTQAALLVLASFVVAVRADVRWCSTFSRTPTVCSGESLDQFGAVLEEDIPRLPVTHLPLSRALTRLDASILSAQQSGLPVGGLHLLRGRVLEAHGSRH